MAIHDEMELIVRTSASPSARWCRLVDAPGRSDPVGRIGIRRSGRISGSCDRCCNSGSAFPSKARAWPNVGSKRRGPIDEAVEHLVDPGLQFHNVSDEAAHIVLIGTAAAPRRGSKPQISRSSPFLVSSRIKEAALRCWKTTAASKAFHIGAYWKIISSIAASFDQFSDNVFIWQILHDKIESVKIALSVNRIPAKQERLKNDCMASTSS